MKLLIYGDLHIEFAPFEVPDIAYDVLVLAGDIGVTMDGLAFAARLAERTPVVYVAGNHEYYQNAIPGLTDELRTAAQACGVHFLEDASVEIDGVRFLGSTLWTDFDLYGAAERERCMALAQRGMNDYRIIRRSSDGGLLTPKDTAALCARSKAWLTQTLAGASAMPTVVVTHHAPSNRSTAQEYIGDALSPAFASHFDELVEQARAQLWIHGHTHHCVDYMIGKTRVVSNQRGYPGENVAGFRDDFIVEI